MTEAPALSAQRAAQIGPGRLVLVAGPSGAGKDTLIDLARGAFVGDGNVVFVRRVVTRPASAFENNLQIDAEAFAMSRAQGEFAIDWEAHGLRYALPATMNDEIRAGRILVANISRSVIPTLRARYANVIVVLITAPPDVLAQRLAARGRPSDGPVSERLRRNAENAEPDVTILNVGRAEDHADELFRVIRGY